MNFNDETFTMDTPRVSSMNLNDINAPGVYKVKKPRANWPVGFVPISYWWPEETNLHHGRFLFRHKGKKVKGKPNYPPTKMIVKTGRKWRKPMRGMRKKWNIEDRELSQRYDKRRLRIQAAK